MLVLRERKVDSFRHSWFLSGVGVRWLFVYGDIVFTIRLELQVGVLLKVLGSMIYEQFCV